ncbi:MAG: 1-deoxy-D-xylulose-5-phosphate synthase [Oscillospiraceae bacterium]|nr:1-deoxy-D-xylulose-5-phosphate synthase [Oscillospiraceae bacterium]
MSLLENINSPWDVKDLPEEDLPGLCTELREFIVDAVSKNGGHLSSNLGVVEITVALHRVFDISRDRLVFDVGHQSYTHKILTGRREAFGTLRQYGGLAGFPKPSESIDDAAIAGHASVAISQALGMARARTIRGEDYSVIALLGDGSLTGGTAYEALSDAGDSGEPLIVVLNDNGMSIAKNVGGVARYLTRLRIRRGYRSFKAAYRKVLNFIPGGKFIYRLTHNIKESIKRSLLGNEMFEDMGFSYLGPVDGHDIKELTLAFEAARDLKRPVVLHCITKKGKGYPPAEEKPELYHGVGPFDKAQGVSETPRESFASVFGDELISLAGEHEELMAITAAMAPGTGLSEFGRRFPQRFFDVGIAEGHAAAMAAGAAHQGMRPVLAVYSTFLQRSYDMLLHDIGITGERVILAVDKAGLVGEDGETHHGAFDVSYLRSVPGMKVYSPASFAELRDMLRAALDHTGPAAIRYPKGGQGEYTQGGAEPVRVLRRGEHITVVTYGISINDVLSAADRLEAQGVSCEVIKLGVIKPLETAEIFESVRKTGRLMVVEECTPYGSVGRELAAGLTEAGLSPRRLVLRNLGDSYVTHGAVSALRRERRLDADSIFEDILEAVPPRILERGKKQADGEETT